MVQVQSSWFPLYDRNPQTFVPEHLLGQARATTARRPSASTTRPGRASFVELPLVKSP